MNNAIDRSRQTKLSWCKGRVSQYLEWIVIMWHHTVFSSVSYNSNICKIILRYIWAGPVFALKSISICKTLSHIKHVNTTNIAAKKHTMYQIQILLSLTLMEQCGIIMVYSEHLQCNLTYIYNSYCSAWSRFVFVLQLIRSCSIITEAS